MNKKPVVGFTREHLEYLEKMFPEYTNVVDANELFYRLGTRAVVKHIQQLVERNAKPILE